MGRTKAELRRAKPAEALKAPRVAAGTHPVAAGEWKAWHTEGWWSQWSEVQRNEGRELLAMIDAFHRAGDDIKLRLRLTPCIRAGRKSLGLGGQAPIQSESGAQAAVSPARRPDPREAP